MTSTLIEPPAVSSAGSVTVEMVRLPERTVVGRRARIAPAGMAGFFARTVAAVAAELDRHGLVPEGPPIAVYRHESAGVFDVTVGFPVRWIYNGAGPTLIGELVAGGLVAEKLPGGRAVRGEHRGPYETMPVIYAALRDWFVAHAYLPPRTMWEEYLVGPNGDGSQPRTRVVYPLGSARPADELLAALL